MSPYWKKVLKTVFNGDHFSLFPANPSNPHIADMMKSRMTQFLSYHNTVNEPTNDELLNKFYDASATWLCQLAGGDETNRNPINGFAPQTIQNIELPLTKEIPNILR